MSNGPTKDEQARGGAEYTATMQDGSTEEILIRQIKVGEYRKAWVAWGDEMRIVALYCSKPIEWVANLSPESYEHIATEGARINLPFTNYCRREENATFNRARIMAPDHINAVLNSVLPNPTSLQTGRRTPQSTPESP